MDEGESTSDDNNDVYPALVVRSLTKMLKKAKEKRCNARCRHRAKELKEQVVLNQKLKADKVTFEKDEQEKRIKIISEKRELAAKLEAVGEENEKLRRMGNEQKVGNEQLAKDLEELTRVHRTEVNNLERANLVLRAKLEKKMKETIALQQEVMRAKKEALDDSLAKDTKQKETERMLEIAKKDAAETHRLSNRQNAEIQKMSSELLASKDSLSKSEEARRLFQSNQQKTQNALFKTKAELAQTKQEWHAQQSHCERLVEMADALKTEQDHTNMVLDTTKSELAETQKKLDEHKTENKALQEFVDRLTEQLAKNDYILEHTEQQEKEAREEFDEQKAYLEGKMEEILSREVAVLKEIEDIVNTAIMDDSMRQERYVFLKRQCDVAEEQVMQKKRRKQSTIKTPLAVDDRGNEMMKTINTKEG